MALVKITFHTGDIISAQFLNAVQDAIIALQTEKRVLLYDEDGSGYTIPYNINTTVSNIPFSGLMPSTTPRVGDIAVGITTGNIGVVTAVSSTTMSVTGQAKRLLSQ